MGVFRYSPLDFFFTCIGLLVLLLDIGLDIWTVVTFYQEKAYVCLLVLVLLLLLSSVLVQAFSWLWYSYEGFRRETEVEKCLSRTQLKLLHVLQLGIYFRHAGVVEISLRSFFAKHQGPHKDIAAFLSHDLSMLRLIETFSESAPQLVLMLTIILQRGHLDPVTVLKAIASASAIAFTVTMYHRSLRSFLPDKKKQKMPSSVVYFLWNLCLVSSRLSALALFASVLPCFIFTHFLCSWVVLLFFAWRSKTDFMDSKCGEWLYRATVGLIWYFHWFNVVEGRTRYRTLLYHGYILADISLLCSLWCWKMITAEPPYFEISNVCSVIITVSIVVVYFLGLFLKMIYYRWCHPNVSEKELIGGANETSLTGLGLRIPGEMGDSPMATFAFHDDPMMRSCEEVEEQDVTDHIGPSLPAPDVTCCNKRMRKLAENFYS